VIVAFDALWERDCFKQGMGQVKRHRAWSREKAEKRRAGCSPGRAGFTSLVQRQAALRDEDRRLVERRARIVFCQPPTGARVVRPIEAGRARRLRTTMDRFYGP
jgi:hypothetical protein